MAITNKVIGVATDVEQTLIQKVLEKAPAVLGAIAVVLACFFLANIFKAIVRKTLARKNADDNVILLVGKVTYIGTLIIGLTVALRMVGIDITAVVGLFGMGLAFALQDILKNFVAGALILIQKPFLVGDVISVGEYMGKIESIESRATNIKTFDGQRVIIPNADVFSNSVTNFSAHPERRLELVVGVGYETDLAKAGEIVMNVIKNHKSVLENPAPSVIFTDFGDSSINISAKYWIQLDVNLFAVKSNILQEVKLEFDKAGINIPFPIRTLDIPEDFFEESEKEEK
jgi:small-conductance mechanosensitive channel